MTDHSRCPYLEYRRESDGRSFETERAYCGLEERFVESIRADICNDRNELSHAKHCEIYLEHTGEE